MTEKKAAQTDKEIKTPDSTAQVLAQDQTKGAEIPNEAEQLRNQLKAMEADLQAAKEEAKAHQRVASEKERKIQELARQRSGAGSGKLRAEVAALMERLGGEQGLNDPTLIQKAQEMREAEKREELVAYAEQKTEEARAEINKLITAAGLSPDDEALETVWDKFEACYRWDGDFTPAKERAEKLIKKMKVIVPAKTKEEEHEEWYRAKLEKDGKLISDISLPSGEAAGSVITVAAFRAMSPQERIKLFKEKPNITIK